MWLLESKFFISSSQFRFWWARSTADSLAQLENYILTTFARKQSVLAIFFDLEKAYDTTWRYHILHQLSSLKIIGVMGVFIQSFLHNRTFHVQVASSVSSSYTQYEGVPQGCDLSTTLFLIAINNIIASLPIDIRSSLYVDDLAIYTSGSSPSTLQQIIQYAIWNISSWATNHGFRFSTTKSY